MSCRRLVNQSFPGLRVVLALQASKQYMLKPSQNPHPLLGFIQLNVVTRHPTPV